MTIHFIRAEIDPQESPVKIHRAIEAELQKQGEPLRWAITRVDAQKIYVEAVVTVASESVSTP